jgi:hypothetical protein
VGYLALSNAHLIGNAAVKITGKLIWLGTPESQETAMVVIATENGDIVIPCAQHEVVQCASLLFEQVEIHLCKAAPAMRHD